jgi:hypothetical protein
VTTADDLVFVVHNIRGPQTLRVRVPTPASGPVVEVHLLHSSALGLDACVVLEPSATECPSLGSDQSG